MKSFRVSMLALALAAFCASAASAGAVSFGAKLGLSFTNVTGVPDSWSDNTSYRSGFAAGIHVNYAFDEVFSVQPELLYVQKGVVGNVYEGIIDIEATPKLDYIEIPLLLKATFGAGKLRPCLYAGPSVSFAVSSELELSAGFLSTDIDISDLTNDTDFGLIVGAGIGYDYKLATFTLDARFQYGFSNLLESGEFDAFGETQSFTVDDFQNYGFAILAGIEF